MVATNSSTTHIAHCGTGGNLITTGRRIPALLLDVGTLLLSDSLSQHATSFQCFQIYENQESEFEKWNRLKSQKMFRKMMKKRKL